MFLVRKMASAAAISKLHVPLRDLVASAASDGQQDFGKTEKDKTEVAEWIEQIAQGDFTKPGNLKVRIRLVRPGCGEAQSGA